MGLPHPFCMFLGYTIWGLQVKERSVNVSFGTVDSHSLHSRSRFQVLLALAVVAVL